MSVSSKIEILSFATGEVIPDGRTVKIYAATDANLTTPIDTLTSQNGQCYSTALQANTNYLATFLLGDGVTLATVPFTVNSDLVATLPLLATPAPSSSASSIHYSDVLVYNNIPVPSSGFNTNQGVPVEGMHSIIFGGFGPYFVLAGSSLPQYGGHLFFNITMPKLPSGADLWRLKIKTSMNANLSGEVPGGGHYNILPAFYPPTTPNYANTTYRTRSSTMYYDGTTSDTLLSLEGEMEIYTSQSNQILKASNGSNLNFHITCALASYFGTTTPSLTLALDFEPINATGFAIQNPTS